MKNFTKVFAIAIAMFGFATSSFAQETASATASATIVTPIAITKTVDMNFGNVAVQSTTDGTVILAPASTRTYTGGVTLPATAGTVTAASFTIDGEDAYTYVITLPSTDHQITYATTNHMQVNSFTSNPSATGALTAGTQTLTVGATLNVIGAQPAGLYVSDSPFDVIVNYN